MNNPKEVAKVVEALKKVQADFNDSLFGNTKVSIADLVVIGGAAAIEKAAADAGIEVVVPVTTGRADATQEQTDVESFALLEPKADAFRNYFNAAESYQSPTEMLIDKADQLNLTIPEMVVLLGGMRALNANAEGSKHGIFTDKPGVLSNDYFVNLLDHSTVWRLAKTDGLYEGYDRKTNQLKYTATSVDLIFGSNSELRAIAEVYAYANSKKRFVDGFVRAWAKVMDLDRFDIR